MSDADELLFVTEGDDAMPVSSSLIAPVALRRDTLTPTSSSKKMRLSASLPRFGMNLSYASPAICAVSLYHRQSQRPPVPAAELNLTLGPRICD